MDLNKKRALATKIITLVCSCLFTTMAVASSSTSYTYNAQGLIESIDGPRVDVSDITTFGYDANGNRSSITNALGHVTQITAHDANGRPLTIVDPNGITTELTYDARGRLLTRTTDGQTTSMQYDAVGNISRITQPGGSYIDYEYDNAKRLIAISDTVGNRIEYTLDNAGNRLEEHTKDPNGQLTRSHQASYDALSRLHTSTGGVGQTSSYEYDPNGNLTQITDALSHITGQSYDALDRLSESLDPAQGTTGYQYDAADNLTAVTDPNGHITNYSYDGLGNQISQTSPDTGTTLYTHDEAGNRLTKTDARGVVTTYAYDALNRLTRIDYTDDSLDVSYIYDESDVSNGIGRLTSTTDATGTTRYHYDGHGNIIKTVITMGGFTRTTEYAYDGVGALTRITYPSGRVVDYTDQNSDGRTDQVSLDNQGSVTVLADNIEYLPFGPATSLRLGNGFELISSYDQDYRLKSLTMPPGGPEIMMDSDGDGISDGTDNCPFTSNANQQDSGGLNTSEPDGIGDACQCGDANNDGIVGNIDAILIKRYLLNLPPGVDPNKCSVNADTSCTNIDAILIQRAMLGLPPGLTQSCPAAVAAP